MVSASGTSEAVFTRKPCICRMAGRVRRMLGSSSTNRILVWAIPGRSRFRASLLLVNRDFDDFLLNRVCDELRLVVNVKLSHQIELVRLNRFHAQAQNDRD